MAKPAAEVNDFVRDNKNMWQFVLKSLDDYLLARWGLPSGLWSSCELGAQAVEKLLKAYILLHHPQHRGDVGEMLGAVRQASANRGTAKREQLHDLEACLVVAEAFGLTCGDAIRDDVAKLNTFYSFRYPDNPNQPSQKSGGDVQVLDRAIYGIWDEFKKTNRQYYYVTGLSNPLYGCILQPSPRSDFEFCVLGDGNEALQARLPDMVAGIHAYLALQYPDMKPLSPPRLSPWPMGSPVAPLVPTVPSNFTRR